MYIFSCLDISERLAWTKLWRWSTKCCEFMNTELENIAGVNTSSSDLITFVFFWHLKWKILRYSKSDRFKRQCRYWSEIWIHGGPQIFLKLRYFEGINDTSWIPKALAPKWTHSRNNEQQRNPWIINLLKHMNLESLSLGEICIQFLSYLDWNLVSMISFERIQKICSATPWGRVIMNNWWGGPKY